MRPEREVDGWGLRTAAEADYPHRFKELTLRPLGREDSRALLDNLLAGAELPPESRALILENSAGNPFYIEEMVRTLGEGGMLDGGSRPATATVSWCPTTCRLCWSRASIGCRMKIAGSCSLAAVIGRSFDYPVLARVGADDPGA